MAAESIANLVFTGPLRWTEQAECRGESRLFFAPAGERPEARATREEQARAVCRVCPALMDCRDWAREHREYGFWGGESEEDRAAAGFRVDMRGEPRLQARKINPGGYLRHAPEIT